MAHYARVNRGVVDKVMVADPSVFANFVDDSPGEWVKCSYNMRGGKYCDSITGQPVEDQSVVTGDEARERKNYPGIGWCYDGTGFYPPKVYNSWTLNTDTYLWDPPVEYPDDGKEYSWNEDTTSWVEIV